MKGKVLVIGAGPAGLTAAYQLTKQGYQVTVYEASSNIGGLSVTFELWGQRVDLGPHRFFSDDKRINELWLEVAGNDYKMVNRLTRIYYNGKFYAYPLKAFQAFLTMGPVCALTCVLSYLKANAPFQKREDQTFEGWTISRFGKKLYHMFFKTYSERLWGISCKELDSDFAAQRIKKFSLGEAIRSTIGLGKSNHKTLVDRFAYPKKGTGIIYERMRDYVEKNGGTVFLNAPVSGIILDGEQAKGIELKSGETVSADYVISTMPLTNMVRSLWQKPNESLTTALDSLTYRNTILIYLHIDKEDLFPDQWLYIHSTDIGFGRICNFRNWTEELYGNEKGSILSLEYWCYHDDEIWNESDEILIERASVDFEKTGLLKDGTVTKGKVIRIPKSYPVYKTGYQKHVQTIADSISGISNLIPIGRYGSFKYNNQDHSILMGMLAAENICSGSTINNLWTTNTDYESYQESATIDETGLTVKN